LWNAAADIDLVPYPVARRIVRVQRPSLHIDCYTIDEARLLLAAADELPGRYKNQVLTRAYWTAAIRLAWDTGIRRGDVWEFRRDRVRPDGSTRIVQHKTGQAVPAKLWPTTIAALDAIGGPQPCRWFIDPTFFGRHFKKIVKAAGVNRGSFKWLRRASGSYVDLAQPGAGGKHLGHSDPATFGKFYDARLGEHDLPMPPEL
jgi:integrase